MLIDKFRKDFQTLVATVFTVEPYNISWSLPIIILRYWLVLKNVFVSTFLQCILIMMLGLVEYFI